MFAVLDERLQINARPAVQDVIDNAFAGNVLYLTSAEIELLRQRHFFRTLPLHGSQQEVETHDDWSVFEYFMAPTWDLEQDLLQYNDCVEVLEPKSLRDTMIEHARNMLHLYNEI